MLVFKYLFGTILFASMFFFITLNASIKLDDNISTKIIAFTLFNYDNLIADGYEQEKPYIKQLAYLLNSATKIPESVYQNLLNSDKFRTESIPVKYLLLLNEETKIISGYYFVDN